MLVQGDSGLLERDAELEALSTSIRRASEGAGYVALIEGPPGIGKTALLGTAREAGERSGLTVLRARGAELEHEFAFGVARQLFERPLADLGDKERAEVLSGAAALAAGLFELEAPMAPGQAPPGELFPLLHGLHWVTANLATRGPLLLAVDDLHWADEASLRFLHYLAGRIDELAVVLIGTARSTEPEAPVKLIEQIRSESAVSALNLAPLSESGAETVVSGALGETADPEFAHAAWRASGGNPFLLTELVRALATDHVQPSAEAAGSIDEIAPDAVRRNVLTRLARAPDHDREVARAVAVLGGDADPQTVADLAGLDPDSVRAAADSLARAGVFEAGTPLRFEHALVRSAVYQDLSSSERLRRHAQAAEALDAEGAPVEAVAAQLLLTEPAGDLGRIVVLRRAATEALGRGAPAVAAGLLRRALMEDPENRDRRALLVDLGRAEIPEATEAAVGHLREALQLTNDGGERAEVARALAQALTQTARLDDAADVLRVELDRANALPRDARSDLECDLIATLMVALDADFSAVDAMLAERPEEDQPSTRGERGLLVARACRLVQRGEDPARAVAVADRALEEGLLDEFPPGSPTYTAAMFTLLSSGALGSARRWAAEGLRRSRAGAMPFSACQCTNLLSWIAMREGRIAEAESAADESLALAQEHGIMIGLPAVVSAVIDVLIERGAADAALQQLERLGLNGELPDLFTVAFLLDSRGRLHATRGDLERARDDLLASGRLFRRWGAVGPGMSGWRSHLALACLRLGDEAEARRLATEDLELARRFGTAGPIGIALRALGLAEGGEAGAELLSKAVEVLAPSSDRLEHARSLVELGAAMRQADRRREAREPLRDGLELATRCGAAMLAERAREELVAAGGRPRRPHLSGVDSLTPSELRAARMAADGMTNREIAQALFVTQKTVETHLRHAYRKLDVANRSELTKVLERD